MKKIFLLLFASLTVLSCSSDDNGGGGEMKITKLDGTEIKNGDVINVTTTGDDNALVSFYVKNTSSSAINVKARLVSATNNETDMQFCFGQVCYSAVEVGSEYPLDRNEVITVPAKGQIGGESFHFQNYASSSSPIDYVFEFFQYNENDEEVGNKVTVTYRYTPSAG
ncbi:hypothetical protein [Flavobacterium sp.]|uniref:hypothetical protein n=1 Tax=Flavobacterium sp. TaxID=239 RepID=UPI00261943D5|nr:hypothetical protein [Flavobacterium sp.]